MRTDTTYPSPTLLSPARPAPVAATLALGAGLFGGCLLGIIARAWMRLISEDPDFTWSGTLFIVGGFTLFGFGQSLAAVVRRRARRRGWVALARVLGGVVMLPLFVAAGGIMLPTVIGGGLAVGPTTWHWVARGALLVVAAVPVVFVGRMLVDSFGWTLHALAGFALMLAVYSTIIVATRCTFDPPSRVAPRRPYGV